MSFFNRTKPQPDNFSVVGELRSQITSLTRQRDAIRESAANVWRNVVGYQHEVRLLNRAIARRNKVNRNQRAKLEAITTAAINLRMAQRAYMADRGNDAFGNEVARAAQALDAVLPPYTAEDKRLAGLNKGKAPPRSEIDGITPAGEVIDLKTTSAPRAYGSPISDEIF